MQPGIFPNLRKNPGRLEKSLVEAPLILYILRTMKKLTTLFSVVALSSVAVAGPVAKTPVTSQEAARLTATEQKSQQVLEVQAGAWADDYGLCVIVGVIGVAALAVGIVALAND